MAARRGSLTVPGAEKLDFRDIDAVERPDSPTC